MSQYEIGALEAKTDRAFSEGARFRTVKGQFYAQSSLGTLTPVAGEQADRARGYLETYWGVCLYAA
jgi:hypothetical protein